MIETAPPPTCSSCACYVPDRVQLGLGICRCLPPVPIIASQNGVPGMISVSPPVSAAGFCFQWRAQPRAGDVSDSVLSASAQEPQRGT